MPQGQRSASRLVHRCCLPRGDRAGYCNRSDGHCHAAQQCLTDLRTFDSVQQKDGYWLDGGGYGYGYPVYGYGYSYGTRYTESNRYLHARPGYEVRTMLASARILAQNGQQVACESVLSAARDTYKAYVTELRNGEVPPPNVSAWRSEQIESAVL